MADSYTVRVTAAAYMTDSAGNATLVDHLVGQGADGDSLVEVSDEFAAYPGVTYSASAIQFLSHSISDPAYGAGYYADPYGFDPLPFTDAGTGLVYIAAPYPYRSAHRPAAEDLLPERSNMAPRSSAGTFRKR